MSLLRVTFLGTAAAMPTANRGLSATALRLDGRLVLFDCGEGTQRQMSTFGTGHDLEAVFFTHFHADHFLGIIGFLRTLSMQGRSRPLPLYGPSPARQVLERAVFLGVDALEFEVPIIPLAPGASVSVADTFTVEAFETVHRTPSIGYVVREPARPGRFHPDRAKRLGVPKGPLFGRLQHGEAIEIDGRRIEPSEVVEPERPGRVVVVSGDTRPCESTRVAAQGADLLIHESTFGDAEQARAEETMHTTAREAGRLARDAGVRRLVLTHLSARYDLTPEVLHAQAAEEFPEATVAHDGLVLEVPYADGAGESNGG